jgi:biopolymer transport protein ExbD
MKKLKRFDQINVIPFIDIMLVLLVMVLTTATFIKQGIIPVDLPKAQQEEKEKDLQELTVYITKEGKLFIEKEAVTLVQLKSRLASAPKDQTVILRSDKEATFQQFVNVMDVLKELQHEQLYIVTKQE